MTTVENSTQGAQIERTWCAHIYITQIEGVPSLMGWFLLDSPRPAGYREAIISPEGRVTPVREGNQRGVLFRPNSWQCCPKCLAPRPEKLKD